MMAELATSVYCMSYLAVFSNQLASTKMKIANFDILSSQAPMNGFRASIDQMGSIATIAFMHCVRDVRRVYRFPGLL
jgi:hypothetical protein